MFEGNKVNKQKPNLYSRQNNFVYYNKLLYTKKGIK